MVKVSGLSFHYRPNNLYTVYFNDKIKSNSNACSTVWLIFDSGKWMKKRRRFSLKECDTDHDYFFLIFQTKSLIKNGFALLKQSGCFSKLAQTSSSAELAAQL